MTIQSKVPSPSLLRTLLPYSSFRNLITLKNCSFVDFLSLHIRTSAPPENFLCLIYCCFPWVWQSTDAWLVLSQCLLDEWTAQKEVYRTMFERLPVIPSDHPDLPGIIGRLLIYWCWMTLAGLIKLLPWRPLWSVGISRVPASLWN